MQHKELQMMSSHVNRSSKSTLATYRLGVLFGVAILTLVFAGSAMGQKPADIVFKDARIYTVDSGNEWAEALAISGNKLVFVGKNSDVDKWIGEQTDVIDTIRRWSSLDSSAVTST